MQKVTLFYLFILEIQSILETHTNFDQLLITMNLYLNAKNQTISLICSKDIDDLKILQPNCLRVFRLIP